MHETSVTAQPAASPTRISRRSFLTRSLLVGLGVSAIPTLGALTACSPKELEPDPLLLELLGTLRALENSPVAAGSPLFTTQADRITGEVRRQCGAQPGEPGAGEAGADGDISEVTARCIASLDSVVTPTETPTVAVAREQMSRILPLAADSGQASLLTGLLAALSTVEDKEAGAPAIDWSVVEAPLGEESKENSARRKKAAAALSDATARIHEAVWLTGRIQPFAGSTTSAVTTVADRLRRIRDVAVAVTAVPAAASYTFPIESPAPFDATGAATFLLSAVHGVTVDLRRAVSHVAAEDRTTVAMWCAVSARCEAAVEDALGRNPLEIAVRGE